MARSGLASWALFAFKIFCSGVILIATAFTFWVIGPSIETRHFPVVSKLRIVSIAENAHGDSVIMAEFTKLRACEFLGLAWYRGKQTEGFERVPVILLRREGDRSSPNRPTGFQRSGPWQIGIPPAEIEGNSFAQLHHRCHSFWVTTTDFYP